MSQSTSILLVCPACKSRTQVPRALIGQRVLCRQCTAELTVEAPANEDDDLLLADEPLPAAAPAIAQPTTHMAAISEDDIPVAPLTAAPIALPPRTIEPDEDYQIGPASELSLEAKMVLRGPRASEPTHHDKWVQPPEKKTLGWTFFSGIFTYFLSRSAFVQWLVFSLALAVSMWLLVMGAKLLFAGLGAIAGGCLSLVGFMFGLAALSYGSACFTAIVENTAYHLDKEERWPEPDYVEWLYHFLRLLYLVAITSVLLAPLIAVVSMVSSSLKEPIAGITFYLLFPILLLSVLESNSPLLPVSPPILRSLIDDWRAWLTFYGATGLLVIVEVIVGALLASYAQNWAPLLFAPLAAAVWFSYARLVGRLASYIMHLEEKDT